MAKYHLRKKEKEITDESAIDELLSQGQFACISMCRENEPYIVTLSYRYDPNKRALYFHSAVEGLKLGFLKANPRVCATVIEDLGYKSTECHHSYRSLVFWGKWPLLKVEKRPNMDLILY
jgi:nitroimidazol reductase NimA-like FMN-containing flavoprotein (pyridoxamine 5'-phosphate oxidase superfamily)